MHHQLKVKSDNVLSVKPDKEKKTGDLDKPILGIAENKVVTQAELLNKRAGAYQYIL